MVLLQAALIGCALALCGCATPPFGEVLLVIDTNALVPALLSRLQVDLYDEAGTWFASRTFTALRPSDWPLSFGVYTDVPGEKHIVVRLRGYPDGGMRDYSGDHFMDRPAFSPLIAARSQEELCANAPLLPPDTELTLRRGGHAIAQQLPSADCAYEVNAGSVAAVAQVPVKGMYRFEIVRSVPDASSGNPIADSSLFLRRNCLDRQSEVGCNDNIDRANGNYLSRLIIDLDPGSYTILTGGQVDLAPADLTLRWGLAASWNQSASLPPASPLPEPEPRLVIDGVDVTPRDEPDPLVTIERLAEVVVRYGDEQTASIVLHGECDGTPADLRHRTTCVDTSGQRRDVGPEATKAGIDRGASSQVGSWRGGTASCERTPRVGSTAADGHPLHDEEVCIPGGAFVFGDSNLSGLEIASATPRQVVVVDSFLLDRNEVTVARYRQALRDGFVGVDGDASPRSSDLKCTFTGDANGPAPGIDREDHPLDCMAWYNARALCRFWGGDLPTSVEWEYAALAASRDHRTVFPWGDDPPTCERAVFGRFPGGPCASDGYESAAVDAEPWASGDRTPDGVVGLAGNAIERVLDSHHAYSDPCWQSKRLRNVGCFEDDAPERTLRGGSFHSESASLRFLALNAGFAPVAAAPTVGFRCARAGIP